MKNITNELKTNIGNTTTNLVRCWKFILKNNDIIGFTNSNKDFVYNNVNYNHFSSCDIDNLKSNLDIENDNFEISNFISSDLIKYDDVLSGKYDNAKIEIFIIDLSNLNDGRVVLLNGRISDIQLKNNVFIASVSGLKDELNKTLCDVYSPICRASFCDTKCKLNKNNYTFSGIVSNIVDKYSFYTNNNTILSKSENYFQNGVIEFTSGLNINQKTEIKQSLNGLFILSTELPYTININDEFNVVTGCDKKFKTCCSKFNNAINFRGEPHLPGIDLLLKVM